MFVRIQFATAAANPTEDSGINYTNLYELVSDMHDSAQIKDSGVKLARELSVDLQAIGLVDRLAMPALLVDSDFCIVHSNGQFASLVSKTAASLMQKPITDLIAPEARKAFRANLDRNLTAKYELLAQTHQVQFLPYERPEGCDPAYLAIVTPRQQTETAQVTPWEKIIHALPIGIWAIDLANGNRFQSATWRQMRGLSKDDVSRMYRRDWIRHVHPDDLNQLEILRSDVLSGKSNTFSFCYREKHAGGHWIWIQCDGAVTARDMDGKPTYAAAREADITDQVAAQRRQEEIATLEQRWRIAIESSEKGLWDHDVKKGTRYHSESWKQLRGYSADAEIPTDHDSWIENIHPEDRISLLEKIEDINTGKTDRVGYEYRERHRDGYWIWILSRGQIVERDKDGKPIRMIGTDTNITDIKARAEEGMTIAKSLELAVKTAKIGVWEFHLETGAEKWDRQMYEIYGLDPDGSVKPDNHWEATLYHEDRAMAMAASNESLLTGNDFDLDYRIVRADGAIRYIRSHATFFNDPSAGRKLIGVNWDITSDYESAAVLREANALARAQNLALEAARAEMEHNSLHDALTGLPNRRKLDLVRQRAEANRSTRDGYCAVLHIDLDRFKEINDNWGHAAGDAVLCHVADILRDVSPDEALVARVGGDEFLIFLEDGPNEFALSSLADEVIRSAKVPMKYEGHDLRFGLSVGIARIPVSEFADDNVFANADLALYRAKNSGRGQFRFYSEGLKVASITRRQCGDDMLAGLEQDEFFCLYQPQFDAQTLEISGIEALVRWQHPKRGLLAPDQFLEVAAELNVVARIDGLVLKQSIEDAKYWTSRGAIAPRIAVNVSAHRLIDPLLSLQLSRIDLTGGGLSFELLESVFLDEYDDQLSQNLATIRQLGIELEIDDFGTGHASIVGLLKLQPDRLKIDRQLVMPVTTSDKQRLLVKSIVEIGKLQGISVVAEGVETEAHIHVLRELGCDHLQGYGLARPMPADDILTLLLEKSNTRNASAKKP